MEQLIDMCTEEVEPHWIKATVEALNAQQKGDAVWFLSLSCQPSEMGHIMNVDYEPRVQPLTPKELYEAQRKDKVMSAVIRYKETGKPLAAQDRCQASPAVQSLLHEWSKLAVGEDGILRRRSGPNLQIVLPQKFHRMVYKELHEEMGHLGTERALHLARGRFYWPRMKRDIEHYVTHVCSCTKHLAKSTNGDHTE